MIGVIERIKNNVLLKCGNLNDEVIAQDLSKSLDKSIYQFAEELISIINGINIDITEDELRNKTKDYINAPIIKKIKRKLFIDSLALQITNDAFIEDYVNKKITKEKLVKNYIKELEKNKKSNQLNMTEDLDLTQIINELSSYVESKITSKILENEFLVNAVTSLIDRTKKEIENNLNDLVNELDSKYLNILTNELAQELQDDKEESKGEDENMDMDLKNNAKKDEELINKFSKYDDMTLFNKTILSLNTKEEQLTRNESKLSQTKSEIEALLEKTNDEIEANVERENNLSQRKLDLNAREKELNSKLSEADVIFLNMKPLIKGLNSIKVSDDLRGDGNE